MSFNFWRTPAIFLVLGSLLAASQGFAQDVRVETQQQARTRQENVLSNEEQPEQVSDPELGDISLVSRQPRPKMFTFFTTQSANFTSNAFLVPNAEQSDFYWNGRIGAAFVPYATRNFTPTLVFDHNWFRYGDFGSLDFNSQNLLLDLKYDLNQNDTWFANTSYSVSRLVAPHSSVDEFYRYGFLNGSVTHLMPLGSSPVNLGITGGAYWRHGDPSVSDRFAGYFNFLAIYSISDTVQLTGFTRPEVQHYTHDPAGDRDDFNITVGASVSWMPREYVVLAATASYIGNFSTVGAREYNVVTPSLIFGAQFTF
jgi:hypothetical protein